MKTSAEAQAVLPITAALAQAPSRPRSMRAITHKQYGGLDVLALNDVDVPTIASNEVMVQVHSAAVHVADCFGVHGSPFMMRLVGGLLRPKLGIPGFDLAGTVERIGNKVTHFKPGDRVFGASEGTCAEYARARENHLALMPTLLSFAEAAAIPTSALAALHALRDVAKVLPGQKVLINGAAGGVGHFAVQIAKSYGAEVTGVCSPNSIDMLRSLNIDNIVDYTQEDFTESGAQYDLILDNVENRSLSECRRALKPHGMLILNSGTGATGMKMVTRLLKPLLISPFVQQNLRRYLSMPNRDDLLTLGELVKAGTMRPVVDRTHPLHDTAAALAHIETGHARGKVVIEINPPQA